VAHRVRKAAGRIPLRHHPSERSRKSLDDLYARSGPGALDPENVIAVHVTQVFSFPSGDPPNSKACTGQPDGAARRFPACRVV